MLNVISSYSFELHINSLTCTKNMTDENDMITQGNVRLIHALGVKYIVSAATKQ